MQRVMWGLVAGAVLVAPGVAEAKKKPKSVTVCRLVCDAGTVQKGVDMVRKGGTVKVRPGTYKEGVNVTGAAKDGITIKGVKGAKRTILQGKGAKDEFGNSANNGVFVDGADRVKLIGLTAKNYPGNGFFVRNATGYTFDKLVAAFNRSYGLYAFNAKGGVMKRSVGYGHGDSAFYVGQTPPQSKPKRTKLTRLVGYENVLGYSGTNSRYVDITDSDFYNNGAGVVPNTLKSEKYAPSEQGTITGNRIFWNNFNYFAPSSRVEPLPSATGDLQYPTGVGVVLFGTTGWTVRDNDVFGHFKWGLLSVSDPTFEPATTIDNTVAGNRWGRGGADVNAVDLMSEGSGRGNCYDEPGTTRDPGTTPETTLYPGCADPRPANGLDGGQLGELAGYLTQKEGQEDSWVKKPHPAYKSFKPIDGQVATAAAASAAKKAKAKTVGMFDNYFGPAKLKVKPGTKVTWKWPADVGDTHDVKTKKVPKGAKKFTSPAYAAEAKWSTTFKKPGKYQLYCTFHETEMTMTVTVTKPKKK